MKKKLMGVLLAMAMVVGCQGCAEKEEDITALELTERMGNGINLGNTMEAYGHSSLGVTAEISEYETLWGQPVTTKEMILAMKEAGFDSLRIPVAWTNGMDFENGDYTIREDLLDRVEEIVNYALEADMYVIINDHWDGSWWGMFGSENEETRAKAMEMYKSMWTQISERFKDYSNKLIFEGANEELGDRLNDKDICADSGALSEDECYEKTNEINQAFVDTVRGTGGDNKNRFLLIAGYNTNIDATCDERFKMPADSAENKLLISIHYYDPWNFCGGEYQSKWGTKSEYEYQNEILKKMTKFTQAGYGVIIGEYGALITSDGEVKENTYAFYENFLDNCDINGFCPMLWDCNGMFNRNDLKIIDDEVAALYASRNYAKEQETGKETLLAEAEARMQEAMEAAPEEFAVDVDVEKAQEEGAHAWIMFNGGGVQYCVGDVYMPEMTTEGVIAQDAEITGEGTYTVSLDFTGTEGQCANGVIFSAIGLSNGEILYPGYCIEIEEILVNNEPYTLIGKPYTSSDNKKCTRMNLMNEWVGSIPEDARTMDGSTSGVSAVVLNKDTIGEIRTISITFQYGLPTE